ncbi:non-ribosomal peptide synthetase [Photobacterium leiognathi]|uniref:non-ribosomal peptide synthetase n=1 Tax=Photobacterium leiognathi TaxID=553611 RepID=UPI002739C358|nr:non-ribosomal peptide synthetase [Photobacterium leiognathi]
MLLQKIEHHFSYNAQKVAVSSQTGVMTYGQLAACSKNIAGAIQLQQLKSNALVAVLMRRNPAIIAALVGIMRADCAYTIVESGNHLETLARLKAIQPELIIADEDHDTLALESGFRFLSYKVVSSFREYPELPAFPKGNATAYVLFTSGSTGVPKGVEVSHDNLTHYCKSLCEQLDMPPEQTFGHVSTLSADLGNTSLFLSLWTGGTLYLASESERKDPAALADIIAKKHIDILKITPTHWRLILAALQTKAFNSPPLECLLLGGEALQVDLARASLEQLTTKCLINHYGPTETTIGVTVHQTTLEELRCAREQTLPIGLPFGYTQILLRGDDGEFKHSGPMNGELFVGGPSVTKGYRGLIQANTERFTTLPGYDGLYYRTGDRVRREADGTLHFLGRVDRQVKINGYRVELESVEREVRLLSNVEQAVAINHRSNNHDYLLCAYSGDENDVENMRQPLSQRIPSYMIPARFEHFVAMPLNINGKVDIPSIKATLVERFEQSRAKEATGPVGNTKNQCEQDVIGVFKKHLQGIDFTMSDDFFQMGGDSLDAIQLVSDLQLQGYPLTAHNFLAQPSVKGVLASLEVANNQTQAPRKKSL